MKLNKGKGRAGMAGPCVLIYNLDGEEDRKLRQALVAQRLRVRRVEPVQYGLPLALLAAGHGEPEEQAEGEAFSDRMMVFCGLSQDQLDRVLTALARSGAPRVALKAVLTPTNAQWDSRQLREELEREHRAMTQRR